MWSKFCKLHFWIPKVCGHYAKLSHKHSKVFLFRKTLHARFDEQKKMNGIAPVCFCFVAMCTCLHSLAKFRSWKPCQVQRSPFIEIYSIWFYKKQRMFMTKAVQQSVQPMQCIHVRSKNASKISPSGVFPIFSVVLHRSCSDFDFVFFPSDLTMETEKWKRMEKRRQTSKIQASKDETPKSQKLFVFGFAVCCSGAV